MPAAPRRAERGWASGPRTILAILLGAVIGTGIAYALHRMDAYLSVQPQSRRPLGVEFVEPPAWLAEPHFQPILDHLTAAVGLREGDDLLDPQLARRVAERLQQQTWVRRVVRVTKLSTGLVQVHCVFRPPAGWVQQGEWADLVDDQGVRLPLRAPLGRLDEFRPTRPACPALILVTGVSASQPGVGQLWPGPDLQAGLRVIALLTHCRWREQVRAVSVANYGGRRDPSAAHILLLLEDSEIRWGRAPGEEMGVEIPAADKIALLQGLYTAHGRIDAGRSHVDVRFSRTDVGVPQGGQPG